MSDLTIEDLCKSFPHKNLGRRKELSLELIDFRLLKVDGRASLPGHHGRQRFVIRLINQPFQPRRQFLSGARLIGDVHPGFVRWQRCVERPDGQVIQSAREQRFTVTPGLGLAIDFDGPRDRNSVPKEHFDARLKLSGFVSRVRVDKLIDHARNQILIY